MDKEMKISIDNAIYPVEKGEVKEDENRTTGVASEQDVAIMLAALKIVETARPIMMQYLKLYKVRFVTEFGGRRAAVPYLVFRNPTGPTTDEISVRVSETEFPNDSRLLLALIHAEDIASLIISHLDREIARQFKQTRRTLGVWEQISEEID